MPRRIPLREPSDLGLRRYTPGVRAIAALVLLLLADRLLCARDRVHGDRRGVRGLGRPSTPISLPRCESLEASACWGGKCTTGPVELSPGYDTIDQGCDGTEPDAACSASASPNGTLTGFLDVAELPAGQITVRATAQLADRRRSFADASVTARDGLPQRAELSRQPATRSRSPSATPASADNPASVVSAAPGSVWTSEGADAPRERSELSDAASASEARKTES